MTLKLYRLYIWQHNDGARDDYQLHRLVSSTRSAQQLIARRTSNHSSTVAKRFFKGTTIKTRAQLAIDKYHQAILFFLEIVSVYSTAAGSRSSLNRL